MRNVQRIRMRCVLLFFLTAISVPVVCIEDILATADVKTGGVCNGDFEAMIASVDSWK